MQSFKKITIYFKSTALKILLHVWIVTMSSEPCSHWSFTSTGFELLLYFVLIFECSIAPSRNGNLVKELQRKTKQLEEWYSLKLWPRQSLSCWTGRFILCTVRNYLLNDFSKAISSKIKKKKLNFRTKLINREVIYFF